MNLKNRLTKLEQRQGGANVGFVILKDGETEDEACRRVYPEGSKKPAVVIYPTPAEVNL